MIDPGTYQVTVRDLNSGKAETITVEADSYRDAALSAAETPFDFWVAI